MKAIVIGAGIGGLAAAIALCRAGLDVAVYERAAALGEVGAGLSVWANGVRALRMLGLDDFIQAGQWPTTAMGIRTWRGDVLIGATAAEIERRVGEVSIVVHRADLHAALARAVGPARIHLGATCIGVAHAPGGVTAQFADGRADQGDLLIGADGLHSVVRAHLHGAHPPVYAGYTAWRAVVRLDLMDLMPGESWGAGQRFGFLPLPGGRVYWFATQTAPPGQRAPEGEQAALLRLFRGWHTPIEALIAATEPGAILRHDIHDRPPLRRWGDGRLTLLGDAAHPMTPNLGQGACQALEDAVVLGRCLTVEPNVVAALRAYETERIPRTTWIVERSRRAGQVAQWRHPLLQAPRAWLMRHVVARWQVADLDRLLAYQP
jgi:2-polyprenyl-6-methoxyphenol hydroxylase-like FAD-dependent oxidoreductase